jgi:TRAP-type C4-dicarboxylate transport system permease small subunit
MLGRLQKFTDWAIWVCAGLGFICVLAMMFQIVGDVFGRYVFNAPIQGTVAITSNWYMVGATFLPLPLVQKEKKHIVATFFADRFPGGGRHIFELVADIVALVILAVFGWYLLDKAFLCYAMNESVEEVYTIPIWPVHFFLPLGSWVMCLQLLVDIPSNISNIRKGSPR